MEDEEIEKMPGEEENSMWNLFHFVFSLKIASERENKQDGDTEK